MTSPFVAASFDRTSDPTVPAVPVVVLAGFLGAGKTSILNHLLRAHHGYRIGVIVNDFGAVNIDAYLVAGQVDDMVAMANGCLCCQTSDEELDTALDSLATVGVDVIVVEASGLADPTALTVLIARNPSGLTRCGGTVDVVDGACFADTLVEHPSVARRLPEADLILLSKTDLLPAAERPELERLVLEHAQGTPVLRVRHGAVDPLLLIDPLQAITPPHRRTADEGAGHNLDGGVGKKTGQGTGSDMVPGGKPGAEPGAEPAPRDLMDLALLTEREQERERAQHRDASHGHCYGEDHDHEHHHDACCGHEEGGAGHLHDAFHSLSVDLDGPVHPVRLYDFLSRQIPGLFRVKGFAAVAEGPGVPTVYEIHRVGRFVTLQPCPEAGRHVVVLIGSSIDEDGLRREVEACMLADGEDASGPGTWCLQPYVRGDTEGRWGDADGPLDPEDYLTAEDDAEYLMDPDDDPRLQP